MAREDGVQGAELGDGGDGGGSPGERGGECGGGGSGGGGGGGGGHYYHHQRGASPARGELRQLLDFMTLTRLPQDGRRGGTRGGTRPRMGRNMSSPSRLGSGSGRRG